MPKSHQIFLLPKSITREQVHPAYTALSEFFDVEFIAYGGASVSKLTKKLLPGGENSKTFYRLMATLRTATLLIVSMAQGLI